MPRELGGLGIVLYLVGSLLYRSRRPDLPIWAIMASAVPMVSILGLVSPDEMDDAININVIVFLIGMFSIVAMLEHSGVLDAVTAFFLRRFKTRYSMLFALALIYGLLSAYMVNDTLAVMSAPIVITISRAIGVDLKPILLIVAFSITIGSVMSPIGNPQNMLVATSTGMHVPFIYFTMKLALPTLINLFATTYIILRLYNIRNTKAGVLFVDKEHVRDKREAVIGMSCFAGTILAFIVNDLLEILGYPHLERGFIPFIIASIGFIASKHPRDILERVSWGVVVLFTSMFIVMRGVWNSGVLQPLVSIIHSSRTGGVFDTLKITLISLIFSQFMSNVPFTNLYIIYMKQLGYTSSDINAWLTLAMATTIAGNLTILGAASNAIMIEAVEERGGRPLSFIEFMKTGLLVTTVNVLIYIPFLAFL